MEDAHVLVVGAGISGLTLGICLKRAGIDVLLVDKVQRMRDAGSGMSVIGHSLTVLRNLGIDLPTTIGLKQTDVSLRRYDGRVLFQVPLDSDRELVPTFGSVQYNVHRGELQQALMDVYLREGGRLLTGKRFKALNQDADGGITATFEDGSAARGALLVGADGARSQVRRCLFGEAALRYSGASCWRGFIDKCPPELLRLPCARRRCMFKTVVHPSGTNVSFTCGWTTRSRCFWVLDVQHPKDTVVEGEAVVPFLLKHTQGFAPEVATIIRCTAPDAIIQTDVYDCRNIPTSSGNVVLIGDAGHAVVHHFGQGACLAIEDAVALAAALVTTHDPHAEDPTICHDQCGPARARNGGSQEVVASALARHDSSNSSNSNTCKLNDAQKDVCSSSSTNDSSTSSTSSTNISRKRVVTPSSARRAVAAFDTWPRWVRTRLLLLISRWCGMFYMNNTPVLNGVLTLCLAWPLHLLFIGVMQLLLFHSDRHLRSLSAQHFSKQ